jgi:hypothetical protein
VFVVCVITLPVIARPTAPEFTGVPRACERVLRKLWRDSERDVLKNNIDWTAIFENMERIGYPENIARKKLNEISWDPDQLLPMIRNALQKPRWNWGSALTEEDSRLLAESYEIGDGIVTALPYWNSLKGFNAATAINAFLERSTSLDEDEAKALASYAPWWLRGSLGFQNAKLFFEHTNDEDGQVDVTWILANLSTAERSNMNAYLRRKIRSRYREIAGDVPGDHADAALAMLSSMPWRSLPADVREGLEKDWVDVTTYRPLRMDSITHIARGYEYAGDCEMMTNGHINTLGVACGEDHEGEDFHNSVLIKVQGELVGSLKLTGDHSMIALRNVMDEGGRLVLAMGGVYHLAKDIYDEIPRSEPGNGHWRVVSLDSLQVHPSTFMLNSNAWSGLNIGLLAAVAQDSLTKRDLIEILKKGSDYYSDDYAELQDDMHKKAWFDFLAALNELRRKMANYR